MHDNLKQQEIRVKSDEYYRQSVLEITEGIVNARVGLEWLPESLMMAADAYEKLNFMTRLAMFTNK